MFTCANCGKEWPENYCPECARTIERSEANQPPTPFGVGPVPTGAVPAHTKQCGYCGQENEVQAANCIQCGTDEFVVPKPKLESVAGRAAPRKDRHPPTEVEYRKLLVEGAFRLEELGAGLPRGRKVAGTSLSGMKAGILTIGSKSLELDQRLTVAGGLLLGLLSFFPSLVLAALVSTLVVDPHQSANGGAIGVVLLLMLAGVLAPPFLIARRIRRFRRRFLLADIIKGEVHGSELELHFRPSAAAASPAPTESNPASGPPAAPSVILLGFKPGTPAELASLTKLLSVAQVAVEDTSSEEKADFARRLAAATPQAWVTYSLVALNVIVFLALSLNSATLLGAPLLELLKWGADFGPLTVNDQQWWRLLTSCFLHLGLLHLFCNMYALLLAGKLTEQLFGNWFFLLLYLGCGLTASLTSIWFNSALVSVGASGAIFGVYGGLLGYLAREGGGLPRSLVAPVAKSATVFILWNLIYGFVDWVNHTADETINSLNHTHSHGSVIDMAAHAGGLLAGLIFGYLGARPLELNPRRSLALGRAWVLVLGIGSVMALLLIPVLKANPTDISRLKQLGELYYQGEGVAKNPEAAVRWLQRAAEQGDLGSQNLLGSMYYQGDGVSKDVAAAAHWFLQAGEQGDVNAEKFLAGIYLRGEGVPTNTAEGLKWLAKVGNQGDIEVEKLLAATYFRGDGVAKDVVEALKWARKVGGQGDLQYQKILASVYYQGDGVEPDKAEAAKWYRLAANQGDTNAQTVLGLMCATGDGVEKNPVEALKWLTLCGDKRPQVEQQRQALGPELSAGQKAEVQQAVQKFLRQQARRQAH